VLKLLLQHDRRGYISVVVLRQLVANAWVTSEALELVSSRITVEEIDESIFEAAAPEGSVTTMQYLLEKYPEVNIPQSVMKAAAMNRDAASLLQLLLPRSEEIEAEDILIAASQGVAGGLAVVKLLLNRFGMIQITNPVIAAAAGGSRVGRFMLEILLSQTSCVNIDASVMIAAVKNQYDKQEVVKLLLMHAIAVEISRDLVEQAVKGQYGKEVTMLLLERSVELEITSKILTSAVRDGKKNTVDLLFARSPTIIVTEELLCAAAANSVDGLVIMPMLLESASLGVTEKMLIAACNSTKAVAMIALLTTKCSIASVLTDDVLVAAASNQHEAEELIASFLAMSTDAKISESILRAATSNQSSGKTLVKFLLSYFAGSVTTDIFAAAAGNKMDGKMIVQQLLSHDANNAKNITESVIVAAVSNPGRPPGFWAGRGWKSLVELLLSHSDITVRENILAAAARNESFGVQMVKYFLTHFPDLEITGDVIVAAVGNNTWGPTLLRLLLPQAIEISQAGFIAAARNQVSGHLVIRILLGHLRNVEIDQCLIEEAMRNKQTGKQILRVLLDSLKDTDVAGNTRQSLEEALHITNAPNRVIAILRIELVEAASRGMVGVVESWLGEGRAQITRVQLEEALRSASRNGHSGVVSILLDYDSSIINAADQMGRNALHLSASEEQMKTMQFLLERGSAVNAVDFRRCSAAHWVKSGLAIAKLREFGANFHLKDSFGWTPLHWAARRGNTECIAELITIGLDKAHLDREGRSARDIALLLGHEPCLTLLETESDVPNDSVVFQNTDNDALCDACLLVSTNRALHGGILIFSRLFKDLSINVRSVKTLNSAFGAWRMRIEYTTKITFSFFCNSIVPDSQCSPSVTVRCV